MHLRTRPTTAAWTCLLLSVTLFHTGIDAFTPASTSQTDSLANATLANLGLYEAALKAQGYSPSCTLQNATVRQEWSSLSNETRKAYTDAVLCLQSKPTLYTTSEVPGARSRYDDFVATHINQTLTIHGTANFLSWHRYLVYTYETALREECGYTGHQPYWNWGKSAFDPINSPVFDGSAYSMSGNGIYEAHNCTNALPTGLDCIPPGVGGGCVETGPFANMTVNLGPVAPTLAEPEVTVVGNGTGLTYNPRCLKRDISVWVSSRWSKDNDSYSLLTENNNILDFQNTMQGNFSAGFYGVHSAGHFTFGGDPGGDLFSSPGDPMFFLHHAQIDRTWWMWQLMQLNLSSAVKTVYKDQGMYTVAADNDMESSGDGYNMTLPNGATLTISAAALASLASANLTKESVFPRVDDIGGQIVMSNTSAPNGTLEDVLSVGPSGEDVQIWEVMDITAGLSIGGDMGSVDLCYIYV